MRKPDPSPAHEKRESAAEERYEHRTGREVADESKAKRRKIRSGSRRGRRR